MERDVPLPSDAQYESFCESRIREIKALEEHLSKCEHGQRAFQKLPRNMQRRNVSYNPQRLPRYLIEKHKREIGHNIKINKRPSRRFRRRPANLLADYNRRKKSQVWLETHIWHAKRFHMVRKWNYVLPKTPTFKSYRASLRAARESCLVQDVSYECCLEIEGPITEIVKPIVNILPQNDANLLKDEEFTHGKIAVETLIYKKNRYPFGIIGRASMVCSSPVWQNSHHKLWIWVHPSIYENVLSTLIEIYDFKLIKDEKLSKKDYLTPTDYVSDDIPPSKNLYILRSPKYHSDIAKLNILKDNLVKFRFIGPESYLLLQKVLMPSDFTLTSPTSVENSHNNSLDFPKMMECPKESVDSSQGTVVKSQEMNGNSIKTMGSLEKDPWWVSFFTNLQFKKNIEEQLSLWNSLKGSDLKSRKVISLVIRDVRAVLPFKKRSFISKVISQNAGISSENLQEYSKPLHPIFDAEIRAIVTQNMKSNYEINKEREKRLIPGGSLPLTDNESRIPVLLMHRPGSHVSSNLGSGWDIVLPSGWGSQMLVALSMNGAVIGGQDAETSLSKEFLTPPPPHHMPDTEAGILYARKEQKENKNNYFKRPPNCRHNYQILGIKFPFGINWMELLQYWDNSCKKFFVVRNCDYLKYLSVKSCKKILKINRKSDAKVLKRKICDEDDDDEHNVKKFKKEKESIPIKSKDNYSFQVLIKNLKNSLIYVRVILLGKGSVEPFATICLPTEKDLELINDLNCKKITEPSHQDENAAKRTALKMEHEKQLNYMRRKRKRARNDVLCKEENPLAKYSTMKEALNTAVHIVNKENSDIIEKIEKYSKKYNDLWLYDSSKSFQSNSRTIIGFLTQGGFCSSLGRSAGLGYVATEPLLELMVRYKLIEDSNTKTMNFPPLDHIRVLIRNPTNLQYYWGRLIILNVC